MDEPSEPHDIIEDVEVESIEKTSEGANTSTASLAIGCFFVLILAYGGYRITTGAIGWVFGSGNDGLSDPAAIITKKEYGNGGNWWNVEFSDVRWNSNRLECIVSTDKAETWNTYRVFAVFMAGDVEIDTTHWTTLGSPKQRVQFHLLGGKPEEITEIIMYINRP